MHAVEMISTIFGHRTIQSILLCQVTRLEYQVARYKSASEDAEKSEEELKLEKRRLLKEVLYLLCLVFSSCCFVVYAVLRKLSAFLGHIECMRCGLFQSVIPGTSLSRGCTWLCCANTVGRIEVLLEVETLLRNLVLDGSSDCSGRCDAVFAKLLWPFSCYSTFCKR